MDSALFHSQNDFSFLNNNSNYWNKYDGILNEMSLEQKKFISKNENVLEKKSVMMNAFLDYLFELNKDSFVSVQGGMYKQVAEDYIESVKAARDLYISRSEQLETENAALRRQLEELLQKGKDNGKDKTTANGTGSDRT